MSALGTTFGTIHSFNNLHLIQQKVDLQPAPVKTNYLELSGADGSIDFTEVVNGIRYGMRTITWTFALYPADNWYTKQSEVSTALNGKRFDRIILDADSGFFYEGRTEVKNYNKDKLLRQITVEATVNPYKMNIYSSLDAWSGNSFSVGGVNRNNLSNISISGSSYTLIVVGENMIKGKDVIPEFRTDKPITVSFRSRSYNLAAGNSTIPEVIVKAGNTTYQNRAISVRPTDGTTATVSVYFRMGTV